jgi:hypothetical protein
MSDRIAELAALIAGRIPGLIEEARDQINESINATMEDAQERENGKAILSLAITAKWDLDGNSVVISMPVSVRRKFEVVGKLEDPNQENLPFVTTEEDFQRDRAAASVVEKALNKFQQTMKQHGATVTIEKGTSL